MQVVYRLQQAPHLEHTYMGDLMMVLRGAHFLGTELKVWKVSWRSAISEFGTWSQYHQPRDLVALV